MLSECIRLGNPVDPRKGICRTERYHFILFFSQYFSDEYFQEKDLGSFGGLINILKSGKQTQDDINMLMEVWGNILVRCLNLGKVDCIFCKNIESVMSQYLTALDSNKVEDYGVGTKIVPGTVMQDICKIYVSLFLIFVYIL